ncbi:putative ribonuclease H-like domain-containing protein, partial [Tanacetum coccineum]
MDDFCKEKGIRREFSVARTPRQNRVAERRNRTLIEAARTMLADSKLPIKFWAKAVSTACYVQNRVLIVKPHNKTPYELFRGFKPALIAVGTTSNDSASTQEDLNVGQEGANKDCIVMPIWKDASYFDSSTKDVDNDEPKSVADDPNLKDDNTAGQQLNTASPGVNTGSPEVNTLVSPVHTANPKYMQGASHSLEATHIEFFSDEDKPEIEIGNIPNSYSIPTTPHTRIHKDHPLENVIGDVQSSVQTRRSTSEQGFLSAVYDEKTHEELNNFARIEAIRLFLAYASFMGFLVYQMDVKSTFLYGTIEEEVYVCQPPGFEDPDKVYKVAKAYSGKWVSYHALGQLFVGKWVSKREDRSNI